MTNITCRLVKKQQELDTCYAIRRNVFVDEQGLFSETDRDEIDLHAQHIAAFRGGKIIGTVRIYEQRQGIWWGSRLAVERRHRGRAGKLLVEKAVALVRERGARAFFAYVQCENQDFFTSMKWAVSGEPFQLYDKQHILMEAPL